MLIRCETCHAMVDSEYVTRHALWHSTLVAGDDTYARLGRALVTMILRLERGEEDRDPTGGFAGSTPVSGEGA